MITFKEFLIEVFTKKPGTQMGSNEGGIHSDEHGKEHYIKYYKNADQAKTEALAGQIYHHMGINTVRPRYEQINGKHAIVTEYNKHLKTMPAKDYEKVGPKHAMQIGRMYHAAILTKNWDIVGLEHDNIVKNHKTGDLHAIDHGGAFHFRAQGGAKEYGPDIKEHQSLRHNDHASGHVFGSVFKRHPSVEKHALSSVRNMNDDHVKGLFKNSGLANWADLHHNFMARKKALLKQYGE